ncbi:MAG: hypothetical protein CGW95_08930 [Phenylobacterium zucineum]|nr:MAG: hypothetical protein CGW95_08930 [Phenylobacterium zucineum]
MAGRERGEIARVQDEIAAEHERVRLLQAEVSHLERPDRIQRLSGTYLGLGPVKPDREVAPDALPSVLTTSRPSVTEDRL